MSPPPGWLPGLIILADSGGNWQQYEDKVYEAFYSDFIESHPRFRDRPVHITKQIVKGKERTFWHCIQEGRIEEERTPDLRRCERIGWIRAIIERADDPLIRQWERRKGRKTRQLLWLEDAEFLVVLEKRKTDWLLWTAYCTTWAHTKKKLRRAYENTLK